MKKILFKGCGTAIATPFTKDGVNLKEFEKLVEFQIQNRADAIIVCGTTGESSTMTEDEKKALITSAIKIADKRVPIIVGTGSNNTKQAIKNSIMAEELGADGLLVVTPYYNKCTQVGLIEHYKAIANSVYLPIILYSVKSRTGVNIEPETCLELSKIENIVAIKEASGDISQIAEIARLCGDNLNIYSGNDDQTVPILSLGGIGVISVLANIKPTLVHDMVFDYLNHIPEVATDLQLEALPLIKALFCETNPIPVKAALNMIGYDFGIPRLPLTEMSDKNKAILKDLLSNTCTEY